MDVYLKLPGHAGASVRSGYLHWLEVSTLQFERPSLDKDTAEFTIYKQSDALSAVLSGLAQTGETLSQVRVHQVEGSEALVRLRFDQVRVASWSIEGEADLAMECVRFRAERWQTE